MKKNSLPHGDQLWSVRFSSSEMPHGAIETNRTCNIQCDNCYNRAREHVKPLEVIKSEIDLIAGRRKLQTLTLMGGEPTLHPDLPAIVAYVKSKKINCQILTNGIVFLDRNGAALLDSLGKNGIDRITVHIDKGQSAFHADIDRTRTRLFELFESQTIHFALSITIDSPERAVIPSLVKAYARYRCFDGIIGFMASGLDSPKYPGLELEKESRAIAHDLSLEPTGYIPSNLDDNEVRWLLYYYMIDSRTGTIFPLSSGFSRFFCAIYKKVTGRFPFMFHTPPLLSALACLSIILLSPFRLNPKTRNTGGRFRHLPSAFSSRFQYIVFQVPPEFNASTEVIELCENCPDITVRNGMLLPLCLADFISPIDPDKKFTAAIDRKFISVMEYFN